MPGGDVGAGLHLAFWGLKATYTYELQAKYGYNIGAFWPGLARLRLASYLTLAVGKFRMNILYNLVALL